MPSGPAVAEDGILLISERENKLPLSSANEKQNKQKLQKQFAEQVWAFGKNIRQMRRRINVTGELYLACKEFFHRKKRNKDCRRDGCKR